MGAHFLKLRTSKGWSLNAKSGNRDDDPGSCFAIDAFVKNVDLANKEVPVRCNFSAADGERNGVSH